MHTYKYTLKCIYLCIGLYIFMFISISALVLTICYERKVMCTCVILHTAYVQDRTIIFQNTYAYIDIGIQL